jgi:hypothetical protein
MWVCGTTGVNTRAGQSEADKSSQVQSVRKGREEKNKSPSRQSGREDGDDEVSVSLSDRREVKVDE